MATSMQIQPVSQPLKHPRGQARISFHFHLRTMGWKLSLYTMIRLSHVWPGFPLFLPTYFLKAPFLVCSFFSFRQWPLTVKESFPFYALTK